MSEQRERIYQCEGCGKFVDEGSSHGRADHAPDCDGSCRNCPIEVECGPIRDVTDKMNRTIDGWQEFDEFLRKP